MFRLINLFILAATLAAAVSCSERHVQSPVVIQRLDIALADTLLPEVMSRYAPGLKAVALTQQIAGEQPMEVADYVVAQQYFSVFAPDVRRVYSTLEPQERAMAEAFSGLKELLDSVNIPTHIYGYVSPYRQSIVLVDTVMLIALNHYLGSDYPGYASFDEYVKQSKTPARIVPDVLEAIVRSGYPYKECPYSTALANMLYEGAVVYAVNHALGGDALAASLGYTPKQLQWADKNERKVWDSMVSKELLFSSSKLDIAKLIAPSPATALIHPDSPGRIGRYVGYRIVESYMDRHPDTPLSNLFTPAFTDSDSTLRLCGYHP